MTAEELKQKANEILLIASKRRGFTRLTDKDDVKSVVLLQDGNFTTVILNGQYVGIAKFNPNDLRIHRFVNRKGQHIERVHSKFNPDAGACKAIHRAISKMI